MSLAYIGIGSNLGERSANIAGAVALMLGLPRTRFLQCSPLIETEPVGSVGQGCFLNGVCVLRTGLSARAILGALLEIEQRLGRDRLSEVRWGPRTIDLDLLVFGQERIDEPGLCVPHPRLAERLFVLGPLAAVAPDLVVPGLGQSVRELHDALIASEISR